MSVIGFVWINRRVGKRVEALTKLADAEHECSVRCRTIRCKSWFHHAPAALMAPSQNSRLHSCLQTGRLGLKAMLNARIGMMLYTKTVVLGQTNKKNASPRHCATQCRILSRLRSPGLKAKLLSALWPAWVIFGVSTQAQERICARQSNF